MSMQRVGYGVVCCVVLWGLLVTRSAAQQRPSAQLVIDHQGFVQPQQRGLPLAIEATITSPAGIRKAEVLCRPSGGREFSALPMLPRDDNVYRAVIPDWMTVGEGLEYYITATDQLGRSTSHGFVGFPLRVYLVATGRRTQEERLKALDNTLEIIRKSRETQQNSRGYGYRDPLMDTGPQRDQ